MQNPDPEKEIRGAEPEAQPPNKSPIAGRRYITLGGGRQVSLGVYVRAWRTVLAASPSASFAGSPCDARCPADRAQILREFRKGLHDRINRHLPWYRVGRKWDNDWQRATYQAAIAVNTPRLIISWLPHWLKGRFAHRLAGRDHL
jgi:hypothetical protein